MKLIIRLLNLIVYKTKIHLNIFRYISTYFLCAESKKKKENNISIMKTYQMPDKWQYITCIEVLFSNQNL